MGHVQLVLAATILVPRLASSQSLDALSAGAHVRVTAPKQHLEHAPVRVLERRGDTLVLQLDSAKDLSATMLVEEVQRIDVQRGYDRAYGVRVGILLGGLGGGVLGYVVGSAGSPSAGNSEILPPQFMSTVSGIAIGEIVGGIFGYFAAPERWVEVPVRQKEAHP